MIRAVLTCEKEKKDVTLRIESYEKHSTDGQHMGIPLVTETDGNARGRAVKRGLANNEQVYKLADLFTSETYNNQIVLDPALLSANEWFDRGDKSFWQWAASTEPNRTKKAWEEYRKETNFEIMVAADAVGLDLLFGTNRAEIRKIASDIVKRVVTNARLTNAIEPLGTGAYLKEKLPLAIEIYNKGGAFELLIPADNKSVNSVISACNGSPWFGSKTAAAPKAPAEQENESARDLTSPALQDGTVETPNIPSEDIDMKIATPKTTEQTSEGEANRGVNISSVLGVWELNVCSSSTSQHGGRIKINSETALFVSAFNDSVMLRIQGSKMKENLVQLTGRIIPKNSKTSAVDTLELEFKSGSQIFHSKKTMPLGMQAGPYRKCSAETIN